MPIGYPHIHLTVIHTENCRNDNSFCTFPLKYLRYDYYNRAITSDIYGNVTGLRNVSGLSLSAQFFFKVCALEHPHC